MLEQVRKCKYCDRDMTNISHLSWSENPYCSHCFEQRMSEASKKMPRQNWHIEGHYIVFTPRQ
jgi:hypothetical protein